MSNHKSVVRNQGYTRAAAIHIERHNERKNENYGNIDVILEQSHRNIHFKKCNSTYLGVFDRMVKNSEISTRGLKLNNEGTKPESSIIAEMVFDVNTEYFEENYAAHGHANGYDFACAFYAEAYKMAVNEVGDEKYILPATLHADERNKGLSEQIGRDVYHYHLHVVYIPIVQKEIKWTKKCKDKSLIGTVKEIINQVNHSKKWESEKVIGEDGKEKLIYSYSKLQDRFHDYMKNAGYKNFERGEKGSTAEHLSVIEYKTKIRQAELDEKENALAATEKALGEKSEKLTTTEIQYAEKIEKKKKQISELVTKEKDLQTKIKSIEDGGEMLTVKQLESITTTPHAPLFGKTGVIISEKDEKNLRATAMVSAKLNEENAKLKKARTAANETIRDIIQTVNLMNYQFTKTDYPKAENLTQEQKNLITSVRSYGEAFVKKYGYKKFADEMNRAKLDGAIAEIFSELVAEQKRKNSPGIYERMESAKAKVKAQEYNERNASSPGINDTRKRNGDER